MQLRFRDSLLLSLGIVMITITLLAFASMTASIFIADTTQGFATAINESGALRMRSYRIATNLTHDSADNQKHWAETFQLINEFEEHLYSPHLTSILSGSGGNPLDLAYQKIVHQWQQEIRSLFDIYLDGINTTTVTNGQDMTISEDAVKNLRTRYVLIVSDFVNNIDQLVTLLEQNAESKIKTLHNIQFIAIILTLPLTLTAFILIYKRIQNPLKQLLTGAERVSRSDFSYRVSHTGKDELGRLGLAFNAMAEDLSKIYSELEDRIRQKTHDLEQSYRSLELLYKTVNLLNIAESPHTTYTTILKDIESLSSIGRGAICMSDSKLKNATMLASTLHEDDVGNQLCKTFSCEDCLHDGKNNITYLSNHKSQDKAVITIPISDQNQQYGVLIIEPVSNKPVEYWQQQLLESIAQQIGIAIKLTRQADENRRLALIEERGAMARELHDSLAQSLTYMKIQLSRLQALVIQSTDNEAQLNVIDEMRHGLNSAYRELRELLTTFRLKIDGKDFTDALYKTILEFNDRTDTKIIADNRITYYDFTANEEIHILQLIREALSNVIQHAHATTAHVLIEYNTQRDIEITIKDDGRGLSSAHSKTHHYGLNIMQERAKALHGRLEIDDNTETGTRIRLVFTPTNNTAPLDFSQSQV